MSKIDRREINEERKISGREAECGDFPRTESELVEISDDTKR